MGMREGGREGGRGEAIYWARLFLWVVNLVPCRRYADPNSPEKCGRTPLPLVVENGHEGVMKLLLGKEDGPQRSG